MFSASFYIPSVQRAASETETGAGCTPCTRLPLLSATRLMMSLWYDPESTEYRKQSTEYRAQSTGSSQLTAQPLPLSDSLIEMLPHVIKMLIDRPEPVSPQASGISEKRVLLGTIWLLWVCTSPHTGKSTDQFVPRGGRGHTVTYWALLATSLALDMVVVSRCAGHLTAVLSRERERERERWEMGRYQPVLLGGPCRCRLRESRKPCQLRLPVQSRLCGGDDRTDSDIGHNNQSDRQPWTLNLSPPLLPSSSSSASWRLVSVIVSKCVSSQANLSALIRGPSRPVSCSGHQLKIVLQRIFLMRYPRTSHPPTTTGPL